jgi:hypothetical protein
LAPIEGVDASTEREEADGADIFIPATAAPRGAGCAAAAETLAEGWAVFEAGCAGPLEFFGCDDAAAGAGAATAAEAPTDGAAAELGAAGAEEAAGLAAGWLAAAKFASGSNFFSQR